MTGAHVAEAGMGGRGGNAGEVRIVGVRIDRLTRPQALERLEASFGLRQALRVYIVNAHTLNVACSRPEFRKVLNEADLVLNDGTGVQIASLLSGRPFPANLVGTDLVPELCTRACRQGVGVFLLGGAEGVAERAGERLRQLIPGLRICGTKHGYLSAAATNGVIEAIKRSGTGILLVAFGNPLQEEWIHQHASRLNCDLCIGVGGLFDHLSGRLRRAPLWIRRMGMEWIHIVWAQPHKWRRYLIGNPLFLIRILAERLSRRAR